jgi:hypothetical protein
MNYFRFRKIKISNGYGDSNLFWGTYFPVYFAGALFNFIGQLVQSAGGLRVVDFSGQPAAFYNLVLYPDECF